MNKWRKVVVVLLTLVFVFGFSVAVAAAKPALSVKGQGKMAFNAGGQDPSMVEGQGKMEGRFKVRFKDVQGHWAEDSMAAMNLLGVINGYPDHNFRPNQPVRQIEAIAMIIRMLGLADQVGTVTIPEAVYINRHIGEWAKPYLALALQKGIITGDELGDFDNNREAKRYQVAVWLARALDLNVTDAAEPLPFKDAPAVPVWARVYVSAVTEQGIMIGYPGHVFHPNQGVKRAEMAALLGRIAAPEIGRFDFQVLRGVVQDVYGDSITLLVKGWRHRPLPPVIFHQDDQSQDVYGAVYRDVYGDKVITLKVADDALIYLDGKRIDLDDLKIGCRAVVFVDLSGEAVFIMARTPDVVIQPLKKD
jgi:hypothetical protein